VDSLIKVENVTYIANANNVIMGDKTYDYQRLYKRAIRVQRRIMKGDII